MTKDTLVLANIQQDLKRIAFTRKEAIHSRYLDGLIFGSLLTILCIVFAINIGLIILLIAVTAYCGFKYFSEYKTNNAYKKALKGSLNRANISISVEKLSHIAEDTIYEPHRRGRKVHNYKIVKCYYFMSGGRWTVPEYRTLYEWSRDYYLSPSGLENVSLEGDEFFYVSLQGHNDISFIYPCKFFVLGNDLI